MCCWLEQTGPDEGSTPRESLKSKLDDSDVLAAEDVTPCCLSESSSGALACSSSSPGTGVASRIKASNSSSGVGCCSVEAQPGERADDMGRKERL
jgi:hypothetical protein